MVANKTKTSSASSSGKREKAIRNGLIKHNNNFIQYVETLNSGTCKNYSSIMKEILKELIKEGVYDNKYMKLANSAIESKINDTRKDEFLQLSNDFKRSLVVFQKRDGHENTRVNILLICFFSLLSLKSVSELGLNDIKVVKNDEFITVAIKKLNFSFAVIEFKDLFIELIEAVKSKSKRKFLVEADTKVTYAYFNKYVSFYVNENISKGGIRTVKNIFTDKRIISQL